MDFGSFPSPRVVDSRGDWERYLSKGTPFPSQLHFTSQKAAILMLLYP
jgi:hypothetical protein